METKTKEDKMEAVKELNRATVESYQMPGRTLRPVVRPAVKDKKEVEGSGAIMGIVHAILLAVPLWAGIIYLLSKIF